MKQILVPALISALLFLAPSSCAEAGLQADVQQLMAGYPGKSGAYVLEKGEESLLARAWLAENAGQTIDIQYFIWSTDNIGILAAEALLAAAERGVRVRVLVDDLLIDAPSDIMLALSAHPRMSIRIYNPKHSVGTSKLKQLFNVITDFRGVNQRMHDKTFMVDSLVAVIGGRNMADEYFDYDRKYTFRDRDILLIGPVLAGMQESFDRFWRSPLSVPVEDLLKGDRRKLTAQQIEKHYWYLRAYAQNPENFKPEVRQMLADLPGRLPGFIQKLVWDDIRFICDQPGKNMKRNSLSGGGATTEALVKAVQKAEKSITIQSPYLVMTDRAISIFRELIQKGVRVRISTNSLAATDNLQAFSGYSKQRRKLLKAGMELYEFRPDSAGKRQLIERYKKIDHLEPVFALHAKTLVIDGKTLCISSYNFDPRSANLNTEVGVLVTNRDLAGQVESSIEYDMLPQNSWNARTDSPDSHASLLKRMKVRFWRLLPLKPLL